MNLLKTDFYSSSYDQYAIQAFKVNSIDYLLKPLDQGELLNAINKFDFLPNKYAQNPSEENKLIRETLKMMRQKSYKERFMVRVGEHIRWVAVDEIAYFVSEEKATHAQGQDGRRHLIDYPLDRLEELLNPEHFFRINRKDIVSIGGFKNVVTYSGIRLKVQFIHNPAIDAIVSRERVRDFKAWLDR